MSWTGVFFGPRSSSPLRGPRNLRGIFAGCELFPVVLLFGVDLVRSCQALDFQMFNKISGYCSQGSNQHRLYCCFLFPKPFYCDFQVLVFSDLFHFLIDSAFSWYCHTNQPHLLLFNHCYIRYIMSQTFICLNFKVTENCDFFILQHFLDIVFPSFFRSK